MDTAVANPYPSVLSANTSFPFHPSIKKSATKYMSTSSMGINKAELKQMKPAKVDLTTTNQHFGKKIEAWESLFCPMCSEQQLPLQSPVELLAHLRELHKMVLTPQDLQWIQDKQRERKNREKKGFEYKELFYQVSAYSVPLTS